jgi:hypothetical protein
LPDFFCLIHCVVMLHNLQWDELTWINEVGWCMQGLVFFPLQMLAFLWVEAGYISMFDIQVCCWVLYVAWFIKHKSPFSEYGFTHFWICIQKAPPFTMWIARTCTLSSNPHAKVILLVLFLLVPMIFYLYLTICLIQNICSNM